MIRRAKPFLLGTIVDISIFDEVSNAAEAMEAAFERIQCIHSLMSFHDEKSDLNRVNTCLSGRTIKISKDLIKVLYVCLDLNFRSDGIFNPAVAPILQNMGKLPDFGINSQVHLSSLSEALEIKSSELLLVKESVCLDLGGIAKGYAVDEACRVLQDFGIENAIVNAGGDLRVIGQKTHEIIVRHPQGVGSGFSLAVQSQALATSAPYHNLDMLAHIDGRNGNVYNGQESISIKAKDCIYADAICKIAFFLSEDKLEQLLEYYNAEMFVTSSNQVNVPGANFIPENAGNYAT